MIASVVPAAAGTTGVSFTRDYLGAEQRKARDLVAAAEQAWGTAYRFIEAGLVREAAEELVRINFNLDRAEVILHGHVDRVANLKSSAFRYIVSEQRQKLTAEFNVILQRLQACQKEASILHQRATATIGTDAVVLQMYLVQQARYRRRIQEGLIDSNPVVNELRELVPFGLANVRAGLVTSETASQCKIRDDGSIALPTGQIVLPDGRPKVEKNLTEDTTAADLAYLKRQAQGLQQQVAQLRRIEEEAKRRPLPPAVVTNVVILTDEVRTVIERQVPAPAPPPATNRIIEYVTNVQKVMVNRPVTNTIVVEKPMPRATSPAPVIGTAIVEKPVPGPIASRDTNTSVGLPDTPPSTGAFRLIAAEPARTAGAHTNPSPAGRLDHSQWTRGDPVVRSVSQARTPLVVAKTGSTPALRGFGTPLLALASTSAAALVGLVLIGIIRWSHRRFDVVIAKIGSDGAATPTVLTVQSKAERIVLGEGHPHVEPADLQHPVPAAITVDRFGRPAITASLGRVHLRDQIVENRTTRLQVGDQVEVHRADHKTAPEIYALREVTCAASDDAKLQHAA